MGSIEGTKEGVSLAADGTEEGDPLGFVVGSVDGFDEGISLAADGTNEGDPLGSALGTDVGASVMIDMKFGHV